MTEHELQERLRRVEALYAGATTPGERGAADAARQRILARLRELRATCPETEYSFKLGDGWSLRLFLALLRRYGLRPYRYRGQRRTTVMVRAPASFVDTVLWPEFEALNAVLRDYLHEVTERVIHKEIFGDDSDAEETAGALPSA